MATVIVFQENGEEYTGWLAISDHASLSYDPSMGRRTVKLDGRIVLVFDEDIVSIGSHNAMELPYEEIP
jgi:hypothetical protein